jgi:diamine N-acetyltransferase
MNTESKIRLVELDVSNYRDILRLKVAEHQEGLVANNAISLAQALFHTQAWYRGIYRGDTPVGFVMLDLDLEKPEYYLWRFMIEEKFQGHGYGFKAMELVIEYVKGLPHATEILLGYVPQDGNPKGFYQKLGFKETGVVEEGEVIMKLEFIQ